MKKGLLMFTGVLTLLFFIVVMILSLYTLAYNFLASTIAGVLGASTTNMIADIFYTLYHPIVDLLPISMDATLLSIIMTSLMILVSIMFIIFAAKEIQLAKLTDTEFFPKRKKLNAFLVFKIVVFLGAAGSLALTIMNSKGTLDMMKVIPQGVNAGLTLFLCIFTIACISKANKTYKQTLTGDYFKNRAQNKMSAYQQSNMNGYGQSEVNINQPKMMDTITGDGNIYQGFSDKVKADLERLDRLHANGALTEDSYQTMRTKIITGAQSDATSTGVDNGAMNGGDGVPPVNS